MTIYNINPAFILMLLGFVRNAGGIVLQDIYYNFYSIFSEIEAFWSKRVKSARALGHIIQDDMK